MKQINVQKKVILETIKLELNGELFEFEYNVAETGIFLRYEEILQKTKKDYQVGDLTILSTCIDYIFGVDICKDIFKEIGALDIVTDNDTGEEMMYSIIIIKDGITPQLKAHKEKHNLSQPIDKHTHKYIK